MKCNKCGAYTPDNSNFCSHCGSKIEYDDVFVNAEQAYQEDYSKKTDKKYFNKYRERDLRVTYSSDASFGWFLIGFFVPIAGFIIGAFLSYSKPAIARKCRLGALYGLIFDVASYFIYFLITSLF